MPDIFRFHTIRGVEELPKSELDKLSIPTHPDSNQSEWFKMLESLCKQNDFKGIVSAILVFLRSEEAFILLNNLTTVLNQYLSLLRVKVQLKQKKIKMNYLN